MSDLTLEGHDPRDIPILTDAVDQGGETLTFHDAKAVHAALVGATLTLADSLLQRATEDIKAMVFESVFERLRATLPAMVERVLREHALRAPLAAPLAPDDRPA